MTRHPLPLHMPGWRLCAHVGQAAPPAHWREALAQMLGHRPRRLGEWTELALYGALGCLQAAGETQLPPAARLRLLSRGGPAQAQREALAQWQEDLPMPFTFMQSQPAITLAALAQGLGWQGDAAFLAMRGEGPAALTALGLAGAADAGLLLGRVEAGPDGLRSEWWRWVRQ
ncbi:hypothetical protein PGB34_08235 [Xenophilus arseniciresistens]|uniref:Uncharacterized protein n=1 Tax=Xenophilus arseniciresistens TaxID=1283306 RepID=A0AAE3N9L0_9BURK|nr:hypothetical protein [Xenophilus arseniciresistens]MDA7416352.1 hypothetical protein [Xenophilus arseniciresistens]